MTSLPVAFIRPGLSCHRLSSDNESAAFVMSPAQKGLIVVRLGRNLESSPFSGLLTKRIVEASRVSMAGGAAALSHARSFTGGF